MVRSHKVNTIVSGSPHSFRSSCIGAKLNTCNVHGVYKKLIKHISREHPIDMLWRAKRATGYWKERSGSTEGRQSWTTSTRYLKPAQTAFPERGPYCKNELFNTINVYPPIQFQGQIARWDLTTRYWCASDWRSNHQSKHKCFYNNVVEQMKALGDPLLKNKP